MPGNALNNRSSISRLVWTLAGVGLCAGALTHGLEYRALTHIRDQRNRTKEAETKARAALRNLQMIREVVFREIEVYFQPDRESVHSPTTLPEQILPILESCKSNLDMLAFDASAKSPPISEMKAVILSLMSIQKELRVFEVDTDRNRQLLRTAWRHVQAELTSFREATNKLDGRRRLVQESLLRRYRNAGDADAAALAINYIDGLGTIGGFRTLLAELSDIEILAQRLHSETDIDQLVSLKDNEMRQTLSRLHHAAARIDDEHGARLSSHVASLQDAIFGKGTHDDPLHQTLNIGEQGLFSLQRHKLELVAIGRRLHRATENNLSQCLSAEQHLESAMAATAAVAALSAETTLHKTWQDSFLAGLIICATFIILASKIARLGRAAELQLRAQNAELEGTLDQLRIATIDAQAASRSKSEFLANMSHEIRTPMTAILGFTDSLLEKDLPEPKRLDAIHTIRRNGFHLLEIINDILDMSKIEAGKMEVECIDTNPAQIVEEVASLMRPRAIDKGLAMVVKYDSPIPERIKSDPTRLRQILLNLVGNAVKFTEAGEITLSARCLPHEQLMRFEVVDSGMGMTPEQTANIGRFGAFTQADGSVSRKFGGTGLGLRISNALAHILGGGIEIGSCLGRGSTFTVTVATGDLTGVKMMSPEGIRDQDLSNYHANDEDATASTAIRLDDLRILLAEDGPDNQRLICHHLKKVGADITIANNGRVAVDLIRNAQIVGGKFDIVLMDMQMPELDGYSATRILRTEGIETPVIALTAHAMSGDRAKCIAAGCNDYLTKPINRHDLIRKCHEWSQISSDAATT
ncbi:MAG: response regulator [Phycisphaerales bacterium]|nr:response regulator [Phycisphaerales bacterium]MCB9854383.1 response regulator [Phycisphaerales bacterium]MCB9863584.1 response regulator [Phycisphaerales bacterium]